MRIEIGGTAIIQVTRRLYDVKLTFRFKMNGDVRPITRIRAYREARSVEWEEFQCQRKERKIAFTQPTEKTQISYVARPKIRFPLFQDFVYHP